MLPPELDVPRELFVGVCTSNISLCGSPVLRVEVMRRGDLREACHIVALIYLQLLFRTEKRVPHALSQE